MEEVILRDEKIFNLKLEIAKTINLQWKFELSIPFVILIMW